MASEAEIAWIDPIHLTYLSDEGRLLTALRRQLREAIEAQGFAKGDLERCVYIIRVRGTVVVAYPQDDSPVLYVGRGDAPSRLASHLKKWLHTAHKFGSEVGVEIRICIPRRKKRTDFFKNVEADLIRWFYDKYGAIPFFNSRLETHWEGKVEYSTTSERALRQALSVGSGNRPQWAIRPRPANPAYDVFHKGVDWNRW